MDCPVDNPIYVQKITGTSTGQSIDTVVMWIVPRRISIL